MSRRTECEFESWAEQRAAGPQQVASSLGGALESHATAAATSLSFLASFFDMRARRDSQLAHHRLASVSAAINKTASTPPHIVSVDYVNVALLAWCARCIEGEVHHSQAVVPHVPAEYGAFRVSDPANVWSGRQYSGATMDAVGGYIYVYVPVPQLHPPGRSIRCVSSLMDSRCLCLSCRRFGGSTAGLIATAGMSDVGRFDVATNTWTSVTHAQQAGRGTGHSQCRSIGSRCTVLRA